MRPILLGVFFFLLWASVGRWYYVCKIKSHCTPATEEARRHQVPKTLGIYFSDTLLHRGHEQFVFGSGSIRMLLTSNNTSFLNRLIEQLRQHQELEAEIIGFFLESEKDIKSNFYGNLGLARAASIQSWLIANGIAESRIAIRSEMADGQRLIEPLKFYLVENAIAGND